MFVSFAAHVFIDPVVGLDLTYFITTGSNDVAGGRVIWCVRANPVRSDKTQWRECAFMKECSVSRCYSFLDAHLFCDRVWREENRKSSAAKLGFICGARLCEINCDFVVRKYISFAVVSTGKVHGCRIGSMCASAQRFAQIDCKYPAEWSVETDRQTHTHTRHTRHQTHQTPDMHTHTDTHTNTHTHTPDTHRHTHTEIHTHTHTHTHTHLSARPDLMHCECVHEQKLRLQGQC